MFDMVGKRVLVTGGGTGIGLGIAMSLAQQGARVIIAGRRVEPLAEAESRAKDEGADLSYVAADMTSTPDVVELILECERRLGGSTVSSMPLESRASAARKRSPTRSSWRCSTSIWSVLSASPAKSGG